MISNNLKLTIPSIINLEKIFFEYDYISNINFYNKVASFKQEFFDDLNININ
jgi:hypothetical protein